MNRQVKDEPQIERNAVVAFFSACKDRGMDAGKVIAAIEEILSAARQARLTTEKEEQELLIEFMGRVVRTFPRAISLTVIVLPAEPGQAHSHIISSDEDVKGCLEAALANVRMAEQPARGAMQ